MIFSDSFILTAFILDIKFPNVEVDSSSCSATGNFTDEIIVKAETVYSGLTVAGRWDDLVHAVDD